MATTHVSASSDDMKEWMPRVGYITRGVIYFIIGALALMTAFGEGGQLAGSKGAMNWIEQSAFGDILLAIVGAGLFGYAVWRFFQSVADVENRGTDGKAVVARIAMFVSGLMHAALGVYAFKGVFEQGGGSGSSWSSALMSSSYGPWLVGIAGVAAAGFALYEFYSAYEKKFLDKLDLSDLSAKARETVEKLGMAGLAARGVVVGIISWFLLRAALGSGSAQQAGLGEALGEIASQSYGTILLTIVAAGLVCFGVFSCVKGWYRRIDWD